MEEAMKMAEKGMYQPAQQTIQKLSHEIQANKYVNKEKMKPLVDQLATS